LNPLKFVWLLLQNGSFSKFPNYTQPVWKLKYLTAKMANKNSVQVTAVFIDKFPNVNQQQELR
jgi:hypothetical protein